MTDKNYILNALGSTAFKINTIENNQLSGNRRNFPVEKRESISTGEIASAEYSLKLSKRDAGADTRSRIDCQDVYTAIFAVKWLLSRDKNDYRAVYVEVEEDITFERYDGKYAIIQVKTKKGDRDPFKTSDDPIKETIHRFALCEQCSSSKYFRYLIASNVGFRSSPGHYLSIAYLCEGAKKDDVAITKEFRDHINKCRAKLSIDIDHDKFLAILNKLHLCTDLPHPGVDAINDLRDPLRNVIGENNIGMAELDHIINDIVGYVYQSSKYEPSRSDAICCLAEDDPNAAMVAQTIQGRKITRQELSEFIISRRRAAARLFQPHTVVDYDENEFGESASSMRMESGVVRAKQHKLDNERLTTDS